MSRIYYCGDPRCWCVLLFALAGCTAAVDPTGGTSGDPPPVTCHDAATGAEAACVDVVNRLESYGCTFASACNASCPGAEVVCTSDIELCLAAAAQTLPGVAPADLPGACQSVEAYCASLLACHPLN